MHEVQLIPLGGLSLPRKSVVRLTDPPDMTLDVYRGHKQQPFRVNGYFQGKQLCIFFPPFSMGSNLTRICSPKSKFFPLRVDPTLEGPLHHGKQPKSVPLLEWQKNREVYPFTFKLEEMGNTGFHVKTLIV